MQIDISQLEFINPKLRIILLWLEQETGHVSIITSLYRIDDPGVHGVLPLRGTDLRCRNKEIGKQIEELINTHWIYDSTRPMKQCAILHGQGANLHLHLQVHPNTKAKGD